MESAYLCTKFVVTCILVILTTPNISSQMRDKQHPSWTNWYNGQAKRRPIMNVMEERPLLAYYNRYPYISGVLKSNRIQWKPYVPNFPAQQRDPKRSMAFGDQRWLNPGKQISGSDNTERNNEKPNIRYVPIAAFLPVFQTKQTHKQTHKAGDDYVPISELPQTQREKVGNAWQEESTNGANDGPLSNDSVTRLIEISLRNGELLNQDEWYEKQRKKAHNRKKVVGESADDLPQDDPRTSFSSPPPTCGNSTFCERVVDYPEELVNRKLAVLNDDNLKLLRNVDHDLVPDVETRLNSLGEDDWPLCRSHIQIIYPRSAETIQRSWLYVINQDNFQQSIRVEVCVNEGSMCDNLEDSVPEGYSIFCKQNYVVRELLAMNSDGTIGKNSFKMPSNCCCHREFVGFNKPIS